MSKHLKEVGRKAVDLHNKIHERPVKGMKKAIKAGCKKKEK